MKIVLASIMIVLIALQICAAYATKKPNKYTDFGKEVIYFCLGASVANLIHILLN